jgi:hypothetical protein
MPEIIAYCGLACHTCPIYLVTRQENREVQARMRVEIANQCNEHYGIQYRLENITDCDGCRTDGDRLFSASRNCPIRTCAREKQLENCARCTDYPCRKLAIFFRTEIAAKSRLDEIRRSIQ